MNGSRPNAYLIEEEKTGYPEGCIALYTPWGDGPQDFVCPLCDVGKDDFEEA